MYKFLPVVADKKSARYENYEYIPEILDLFFKYRDVLTDDYYSNDSVQFTLEIIDLINSLYPHFYAIIKEKDQQKPELIGFVYLDDLRGNDKKIHSCTLTSCFDHKFWGFDVGLAAKKFFKMVFDNLKVHKIKAQVFEHNKKTIKMLKSHGFEQEGFFEKESFKNGLPLNILQFCLFNDEKYTKKEL